MLEHVDLYNSTGPGPVDDLDYMPAGRQGRGPPRRARTSRSSPTCRWCRCLEAVEEFGQVDAEVIDLRWLDRASLDWDTIEASITQDQQGADRRAGRASAPRTAAGWPTRSSAGYFDWLDAPVARVHGGEASPSISKVLERAAIAQTDEVVAELTEIARY